MNCKILAVVFSVAVLFFTACGGGVGDYPNEEDYSPAEVENADYYSPVEDVVYDKPEIAEPIYLSVIDIPYGVEPAEFLSGLGYDSYADYEHLRWASDWIALSTNTAIRDLRILQTKVWYEAAFDDGWQFTRHYTYAWTYYSTDLMPDVPFVMAYNVVGWADMAEGSHFAVSYVDEDGRERFFILRSDGEATYLEEFENVPQNHNDPEITILSPSPEIELITAIVDDWQPEDGSRTSRDIFLSQFDTYTELENPNMFPGIYAVFSADTDLRDFQFFSVGQVCDPWVDGEWHMYFIHNVLDAKDVLPFGEPVIVPWHGIGTMPGFGISFLDENDNKRAFTLNTNNAGGYPPMHIIEFIDRVYCPECIGGNS